MNRLFLTLMAISAVLIQINAQCSVTDNCPKPGTVCAVGESDLAQGGFCQEAKGDDACKAHCTKTYGAELVNATCSAPRANKQRECICQLKCQNGGCWGDPHCWSWDGTLFGYQSLKKYYVFKPINKLKTIPDFEIIQSNHPWCGGAMATLDTLNFIVPDWGQLIEVKAPANQPLTFTVNGQAKTAPFRWSSEKAHRENFIEIAFPDPARLVITTSFGVAVTVHNDGAYSDLSVNIPRHPELKNNTGGVLGRWNDNPADDNLDASGKPQPLVAEDSAAFGNSWLLPGEKLPTAAELEAAKKHHDDHVKSFNKEHWDHLVKMCKENLEHGEIKHCMKQLGRPCHEVNDCALDLSHIVEEADQHAYLAAKVKKFKQRCPHHKLEYKHHKRPAHIPNHKHKNGHSGKPEHVNIFIIEGVEHRGERHPLLPHHKWGQPKPEHKDKCFKVKEQFKGDGMKLHHCLAHEGFYEQ